MQRARVVGRAVATAKHPTMDGQRLLLMQALDPNGKPDADPFLVVDALGAAIGSTALITSDGKTAQAMLGKNTPVRYTVVGIEDEKK
jgi:ethanolamine utilization protein EutN